MSKYVCSHVLVARIDANLDTYICMYMLTHIGVYACISNVQSQLEQFHTETTISLLSLLLSCVRHGIIAENSCV